jgi:hypothetical protein
VDNQDVARALGWEHDTGGWWWTGPNRIPAPFVTEEDARRLRTGEVKDWDCEWLPDFLGDTAQAARVVEHFRLWVFPYHGVWYAGQLDKLNYPDELLYRHAEATFHCLETGSTPMEAICKAAVAIAKVGRWVRHNGR